MSNVLLATGLFTLLPSPRSVLAQGIDNEQPGSAPSPDPAEGGLGHDLETLLSTASTRELDRLVSAPDCTVALAAGWERVQRTVPEPKNSMVTPDEREISRFLTLVEARIRVPLPKEWKAALKTARGDHHKELLCFITPELTGRARRPRAQVRREGDKWLIEKDFRRIKIPLDSAFEQRDEVAVHLAGHTGYIAPYDWMPLPHRLFAVDRTTSRVLWSSEVRAAGLVMGSSGDCGQQVVTLSSTSETVAVFGIHSLVLYVCVFDRMTGERRCRFSTRYFDQGVQYSQRRGEVSVCAPKWGSIFSGCKSDTAYGSLQSVTFKGSAGE
jgi:hypothetical protein